MQEFILQEGVSDGKNGLKLPATGWAEERVFLDDRLHKGNTELQVIPATSWLAAREAVPDFI